MAREEQQEQEQTALGAAHVHHHHQPPAGGCGLSANPTAAEYAHGTHAALPFFPPVTSPLQFRMHAAPRGGVGRQARRELLRHILILFTIATIPTRRRPVWDDETN